MQLGFKARLSIWHVAIVTLILAVTALAADIAFRRVVLGQVIDGALLSLAELEAGALQSDPRQTARVHEMAPGTAPPSFVRLDKFVQIIDSDGRVVARSATLGTASLPAPPELLVRLREGEAVFETVTSFGEEPVRMVTLPVAVESARYAVQVAMSLDDAYAVLRAVRWLFLGMSLGILLTIGLTGMLLARRALHPIDRIVRRARRIGEANLAERLPVPEPRDEIRGLVETLNEMLGRLEKSFEVQRRFTADASHELRSPLSRLRAELELALRRRRPTEEYEETLRSCLEEVERLQRLTEELLVLARLDAGEGREDAARPIPVDEILHTARRGLEAEARQRGVRFVVAKVTDGVRVRVAPAAASMALANVLHNAVKFSRPGAAVAIAVRAEGDEAAIAVSDSGPGVAPEDMARLFERFYRGSAAQTADAPGVGLGLAITKALVEGQGGRVSVETAPGGGAVFVIHLPLVG